MARVSAVPPFEPTTPTACAQRSSMAPLPLMVVATGAASFSASSVSSASACEMTTPPPQMNNGLREFRSSLAASATISGSGALRRDG